MHPKFNNLPTQPFRPPSGRPLIWGVISLFLGVVFLLSGSLLFAPTSSRQTKNRDRVQLMNKPALDVPVKPPDASSLFRSESKIRLFKQTDQNAAALQSGAQVFEGDRVQVQYRTTDAYGVILSVDGRGVVSLHFPNHPERSTQIPSGTHLLPFSFELDDAPGFETFFFITSRHPLDMTKIMRAARKIRTVSEPLPVAQSGIQVRRVVLHKQIKPQAGHNECKNNR
ncbi:MAG: DUF4384 domain-containing protein [Deltaproteobacteria bacterium]|nr:DUF4384 domain-containing protein [Deltaproteobacteria bacterium]MBN2674823.1 DUF4384 domain-containing protein [Deltaproteobacteria bacterium]